MYGLDPNTDLRPVAGGTLNFVGIGQHQVQLHFSGDPDCSVTIEGHYSVGKAGESLATFSEVTDGASDLVRLLGSRLVGAEVIEARTVRFTLDSGSVIEVHDSETARESYQVTIGDRLIVV